MMTRLNALVVSKGFDTVAVTVPEDVRFPAASRATATSVCGTFVAVRVSQVTAYGGAVISAPRFAPSSVNWTPATPTLSAASAVTEIGPETVAPSAGAVMTTVGGVVSHGSVVALSVDWGETLPEAS